MKYNELTIEKAKKARRSGRGIAAGRGKTAGRGTKGQGARKSSIRHGFAGGQTPLYMQLPKLRGFKSKRVIAVNVYTGQLQDIKGVTIDPITMFEAGIITSPNLRVKLISNGELKTKKTVKIQAASKSAIAAVEAAGGSVELIDRIPRAKTSTKPEAKK
jgi:large subunit ribosomal protein L15